MSARSPGLHPQVGETFRSFAIVVAGTEEDPAPARQGGLGRVDPYIALATIPVIFIGELPDKTMFASLVLATKGRPVQVWLGAGVAFAAHVAIAVTAGVALFSVLPKRYLDWVIAVMFVFGAFLAWRESTKGEEATEVRPPSRHGAVTTAFVVIFLAEWGDLTQILTANLAARYHAPLSVAVGSVVALWAVAALAVASGKTLVRFVNIRTIRRITTVILLILAAYTAWSALR